MKKTAVSIILFLCLTVQSVAEDSAAQWRDYFQNEREPLRQWIFAEAREALGGVKNKTSFPDNNPEFYGKAGLFVTLRSGRTTRGCYGAFYHGSPELKLVLCDYIRGALRRDPRHEPPLLSDLDSMDIILTVASFPESSEGIAFIDTRRTGVMIQYEDENTAPLVFVPGELANNGKIEEFTRGRPCQLFTFDAVTFTVRQ